MSEKPKIMYDSQEAAEQVTLTGWKSRNGFFYGNNEHLARWDGCTHLKCDCGNEMTRGWTKCDTCRAKNRKEHYEAMPFKEWDGVTPLVIHDDNTYFFDDSEIETYCEDNDLKPEDLRICICEPQYAWEVFPDECYCDILPEDRYINDIDQELAEAFEILNVLIRQRKTPISWTEGKYRTNFKKRE